jgi:hypothetical protein
MLIYDIEIDKNKTWDLMRVYFFIILFKWRFWESNLLSTIHSIFIIVRNYGGIDGWEQVILYFFRCTINFYSTTEIHWIKKIYKKSLNSNKLVENLINKKIGNFYIVLTYLIII